jgi:hypothetical protein
MFKAYPIFIAARDERRSSKQGFMQMLAALFGWPKTA